MFFLENIFITYVLTGINAVFYHLFWLCPIFKTKLKY